MGTPVTLRSGRRRSFGRAAHAGTGNVRPPAGGRRGVRPSKAPELLGFRGGPNLYTRTTIHLPVRWNVISRRTSFAARTDPLTWSFGHHGRVSMLFPSQTHGAFAVVRL